MPRKKRPGTLATLLNALVGMEVVLELKTDVQVLGFVEWADNAMKCVPRHPGPHHQRALAAAFSLSMAQLPTSRPVHRTNRMLRSLLSSTSMVRVQLTRPNVRGSGALVPSFTGFCSHSR